MDYSVGMLVRSGDVSVHYMLRFIVFAEFTALLTSAVSVHYMLRFIGSVD